MERRRERERMVRGVSRRQMQARIGGDGKDRVNWIFRFAGEGEEWMGGELERIRGRI